MSADPGRSPGPWERYGWVTGAVWLVFLAFPVVALLTGDTPPAAAAAGLLGLAAFAAVYVHGLARIPEDGDPRLVERLGLRHLAVMVGLTVAVCLVAGGQGLATLPFVVALAMFTLRLSLLAAVVVAALGTPVAVDAAGWVEDGSGFQSLVVLLVTMVTGMIRLIEGREVAHRRLERELEIVAERDRVARDVHDVLGHSLTVVATKAELAARLLEVDPERTRAELEQIQSLTREALAEIRATVAGLRVARLGEELRAARTALEAAGIEGELPEVGDVVDPRHRLVLAWVLREAVTNVVRHSGARRCTVTLAPRGISVVDDGRGREGAPEGNGLRGIRERVAAAGGRLDVGTGPDGRGTRVEVTL